MNDLASAHPAFAALSGCHPQCHLSVTIPVRNEEAHLWACLRALHDQRMRDDTRVDPRCYEVLLLLNGCSDGSARVAARFRETYPDMVLHVVQWNFPAHQAHVGSARSLLLQEASRRLVHAARSRASVEASPQLLLTTDADTVVDGHWLAENVQSVLQGADAVGGDILTRGVDRRDLPRRVRRAYALDRRYRRAIARLEDLLDPLPHDPWPRHHHHFGGSLACTLQAYQRIGGMRPVAVLEDVSFYEDLIRSGARFRHEPRVRVFTSARTEGRVSVGLSEQLNQWTRRGALTTCATEFVVCRLRARALLRDALRSASPLALAIDACAARLGVSAHRVRQAVETGQSLDGCWRMLDGDALVHAGLASTRRLGNMTQELRQVQRIILQLRGSVAERPCDTLHGGAPQPAATMAG